MIRFCLVVFSIVCGINISAQNTVKNCMEIFSRQDTVNNPADKMLLWQDCVVDKDIPDINVKTIDGSKLKSKDLKGKISVINRSNLFCPRACVNNNVSATNDDKISFNFI